MYLFISEKINNLGKILFYNYRYIFKQCTEDINEKRSFKISGDKLNIITKTGQNFNWTGITCIQEFNEYMEYKWKIKISGTIWNINFSMEIILCTFS